MKNRTLFFGLLTALFLTTAAVHAQNTKKIMYNKDYDYYYMADANGKFITMLKYEQVNDFHEGLAKVSLNGKNGFIDQNGKEVIPLKFNAAGDFSEGLAYVLCDSLYGFINKTGAQQIPCKYEIASGFSEGLAPVFTGNGWGYIDKKNKLIIPAIYFQANDFHFGLAAVMDSSYHYGYIDKNGKPVIPIDLYGADDFIFTGWDTLAIVRKPKCGVINTKGDFYLSCDYIDLQWIENGDKLFVVKEDSYYNNAGIVTSGNDFMVIGDALIPIAYTNITPLVDGYYMVTDFLGKKGIHNGIFKTVPVEYDNVFYQDSMFYVNNGGEADQQTGIINGGKAGLFNMNGDQILPVEYDYIGGFSDGLAVTLKENQFNIIDRTGKTAMDIKIDYIMEGRFNEGVAAVNTGGYWHPQHGFVSGKWGFIDTKGNWIIPCKYDAVSMFSEGCAGLQVGNLVGAIDRTGKEIIPITYDNLGPFVEGIAFFAKDYLYGFKDKNGNEICPNIYHSVGNFSEGYAIVMKDNKVGFIDKTGKEAIPLIYEGADPFINGIARVRAEGRTHLINTKGEKIK